MKKAKKKEKKMLNQLYGLPEHIETLYKAEPPLTEVEEGHGYYGVVLYDRDEDKVQCHICGKWFKSVTMHVLYKHELTKNDYVEKYGLSKATPLVSRGLSSIRSKTAIKNYQTNKALNKKGIKKYSKKIRKRMSKGIYARKNSGVYLNERGICFEQLKRRYYIVKDTVGREITNQDLKEHDPSAHNAIRGRYRGLNRFKKLINETPSVEYINYPEDKLIANIRAKAAKIKRLPVWSDFPTNTRPNMNDFLKMFGSWSRARSIALGLDRHPKQRPKPKRG